MTANVRRPVFLESRDEFCDGVMQSLTCNGQAPHRISMRQLSLCIGPRALHDAKEVVRMTHGWANPAKMLTAASRHAGIARRLRQEGANMVYVWRGLLGRAALAARAANAADLACVFFERGPLPGWLQIDMQGVNARSSIPRDAAFFRNWRSQCGKTSSGWRDLRETLAARSPRRKQVAQAARADWSDEAPFLFCPLQLNAASDLLPDAGWVADPADLIAALAAASRALPAGWHLRLKPHPNARGDLARLVARHPQDRLVIDRDTNSLDQLRASQGVITVNSAMGLEAFFFDKPVIVLGASYYGGLGRTRTADSIPALSSLLRQPWALDFDQAARDDLMDFLFSDFFVPEADLRAGRFDVAALVARHARHRALMDLA